MKTRKERYSSGLEFPHMSVESELSSVMVVLLWHTFHGCLDLLHGAQDVTEAVVDLVAIAMLLDGVDHLENAGDKSTSLFDHVDVGQDEAGLRTFRVKPTLKTTDQTEVRVLAQSLGVVGESIVE